MKKSVKDFHDPHLSVCLSVYLSVCLQVLSIYQNRSLITVFHGEQDSPDDFETVMLRALVRGELRVVQGFGVVNVDLFSVLTVDVRAVP